MPIRSRPKLAVAALVVAMAVGVTAPAAAQTPEQFYAGRTVKIMVGHGPGGSYDFYARLAADMLKKHLAPGAHVIVENKPGGGGVVATGHFYAQGSRDGTMLAVFPETSAHTQILDPATGRWKMEQMAYIGSFAPSNSVLVRRRDSPARTIADMRTTTATVGCSGVTSQSFQYPAMLKVLAGFKFRMVCGYPGSAEYLLALEKGEVDLVSNSWNALRITHLKQVQSGEMPAIVQFGLKRNRELPDVPLMQDLVTDAQARAAIVFASAGAAIGRALLAPPGVSPERIAYLRAMFDKMVADPELIEMARKRGLELDPTSGIEVQKIVEEIIRSPKELIERAAKAMAG